jgi:plastocyanin
MRRSRLVSAAFLAALLAGCSAASEAGWTYAPASTTPVPSGSPVESGSPVPSNVGEPTAPPSQAAPSASGGASAGPSAAPSGSATGGTALTVVARAVKWETATLTGPAGSPLQVTLDNQDQGIPHNVAILNAANAEVFKSSPDLTGVAQETYDVEALEAGVYKFVCTLHPGTMTGELTVQ